MDSFPADANRNYGIPADNPFVGVSGADEIWAYGLRNPWRLGFDPRSGDLYIADVGQSAREEVNFLASSAGGGANFGWRIMEGSLPFNPGPAGTPQPGDASLVLPVFEYGRAVGSSITGGEVYTGTVAAFVGQYVFADYSSDRLFSLSISNGVAVDAIDRTVQVTGATLDGVVDFVTDSNGALYAIGIGGTVWLLTPSAGAEDGNDILNGGAGNDYLDGGAGVDQLFGGDGDDVVIWDAADNLANVQGEAGFDLLVFLSGTAPTTFDLAAHGFEAAEGRLTDADGQLWATHTLGYDVQWRLDTETTVFVDGSRAFLDHDQIDAFVWLRGHGVHPLSALLRVASCWNLISPVSISMIWMNRLYWMRRVLLSLSSTLVILPVRKYWAPSWRPSCCADD
jgi:hypothetical protein